MGKQRNAKLARSVSKGMPEMTPVQIALLVMVKKKTLRGSRRYRYGSLVGIFKRLYRPDSIHKLLPDWGDLFTCRPLHDYTTDTPIGENVHEWFAKKDAEGRGFEDSRFPSRLKFSKTSIGDRAPVQNVAELVKK